MNRVTCIAVAASAFLLAACDNETWCYLRDLKAEQEQFAACMVALPKGPQSVVTSNDWDEVVAECRKTANALTERAVYMPFRECNALKRKGAGL